MAHFWTPQNTLIFNIWYF